MVFIPLLTLNLTRLQWGLSSRRSRRVHGESGTDKVMKVLNGSKGILSPKEIALKAHMNRNAVRRLVQELYLGKKISRPKRGFYKAY